MPQAHSVCPQLGTASPKPLLRTTASADDLHLPSDGPLSPQDPPANSKGPISPQKHPAGSKSPLKTQKPSTIFKRPVDSFQPRPVDDPPTRATPDNSIHITFPPQHPNRTGTQSTTPSKSGKSGHPLSPTFPSKLLYLPAVLLKPFSRMV